MLAGEPTPTFSATVVAGIGATRCDFFSFHHYGDSPQTDLVPALSVAATLRATYLPAAQLLCSEWNMDLSTNLPKFSTMQAAIHSTAPDPTCRRSPSRSRPTP